MVARANWRSLRGSAFIEFIIVLPILLVIIAAVVDFSILFYNKAMITNASREGARYGVLYRTPSYPSNTEITTRVQSYVSAKLITFAATPPAAVVNITRSTTTPKTGDTLTVQVTYTYTDILLHRVMGSGTGIYTLTAQTTMTYE